MGKSNEKKAKEIADKHKQQCYYAIWGDLDDSFEECYQSAMQAMKWKDKKHAKEKQQWIEKACIEFCNNCNEQYGNCEEWCKRKLAFEKAMKGE